MAVPASQSTLGQPATGTAITSYSRPNPTSPAYSTLDLTDFTPGIHSRLQSVIKQFPVADGAAHPDWTFGCYALQDGGLAPMPRVTFFRTAGDPALPDRAPENPPGDDGELLSGYAWPATPTYPADYDHRIAVLDSHLICPVQSVPGLSAPVNPAYPAVDLFTVRQWYMIDTTYPSKPLLIWRFRNHPVYTGSTDTPYCLYDVYSQDIISPAIHPSRWTYAWGSIAETRTQTMMVLNDDSPPTNIYPTTNIGPPVIVAGLGGMLRIGVSGGEEGVDTGQYVTYPDYHVGDDSDPLFPHAVLTDDTFIVPQPDGVAFPGIVFGHQGRLCSIQRVNGYNVERYYTYHGNHDGYRAGSELVAYFPVNGVYNAPGGPVLATYLEEASTGYGTVHSVNANSLLLIKNVGGAVQITGDLNQPTVQRLPGIPSVGGKANRGAVTDQGFVYGSTSGVWIWTGSDSASPLSPQLDPLSWLPEDPTIDRRDVAQLCGSFGYRWPWIFAPNNWCYDMRTNAWFRYYPTPTQSPAPDDSLEDAGTWQPGHGACFAFNDVDHDGNLWATVPSYLINGIFFAQFDAATGTNFWSWESQPINKTMGRFTDFRQVTIAASGVGRVVVTLAAINQAPQSAIFDLTLDVIDIQMSPLALIGTDVTMTITAEAFDDSLPAPTVHRVSLAYREDQQIPATGAH